MSATLSDARPARLGWLDWLRRELAPSHERKVRTLVLVCGTVLCVIISMGLQVPELAVSAYMVFFISKENKTVTTMYGVLGMIGVTIGIAMSLLLYKLTYGYPALRIPSMAIAVFLGMYLSRVLVLGPLGFIIGFIISATQSIGDLLPSPELLVRAILWIWVALAYAVGLTVVLNRLFLPGPTAPPKPLPKSLFVPDAFTNPGHFRFALKVTLAAMFCYVFYCGIDWFGIHTAFITCVFIALESTGRTLYKGILRAVGCIIGGLIALFSIVFLIPHMETIASLVVLVACVSAIAGWVATGTERIAYAGLQIAFAFFYSIFQSFEDYRPDTDLDNVRNRVVGILLGLLVTAVVFQYLWPERAIGRLRSTLREVLQQLARLLVIPGPETPLQEAEPKVERLVAEISRELAQAQHLAELTNFELEESAASDPEPACKTETLLTHIEHIFASAKLLAGDGGWQEWSDLPPDVQRAESELRHAAANRIEQAGRLVSPKDDGDAFEAALHRWNEALAHLLENQKQIRVSLVSRIAAEIQQLA